MAITYASLVAVFLAAVLLDKKLRGVSAKELRRRAREGHDKKAARLYKLAAFGASARLFLWLVALLSASGLIIFAANNAWWLGVLAIIVTWLLWTSRPSPRTSGVFWALSAWLAPLFSLVVGLLQPILGRVAQWLKLNRNHHPAGVYVKEDLVELIGRQARQADNRIAKEDLTLVKNALNFADISVSRAMIPRRQVKWAVASDPIGPMLADELHQSGQDCFPVVKAVPAKGAKPEVVGTLHLKDLLEHLSDKGRIRDIMQAKVGYINETQNLPSATQAFLSSGSSLLVVVNNFEEIAGVLTLKDLLKQIFGDTLDAEDEYHADIRAAASHNTQHPNSQETDAAVH